MVEKPLFVPLDGKYYDAILSGEKRHESRSYGKQWTEKHVYVGRRARFSYGYGKIRPRLYGTITKVTHLSWDLATDAFKGIYPENTRCIVFDFTLDGDK